MVSVFFYLFCRKKLISIVSEYKIWNNGTAGQNRSKKYRGKYDE